MLRTAYMEQAGTLGLTVESRGAFLRVRRGKALVGLFPIPIRARNITKSLAEWEAKMIRERRLVDLRGKYRRGVAGAG